jgi:LPS-assembly lipoprotein
MRSFHNRLLKQLFLVLISVSLSACGFHLRGDYDVPDSLNKLSVTSYDQYSQFTRMVKNQLRQNEIHLVKPAQNIPNLHLLSESVGSRTLSVYQNTRAAEKDLTLNISYRVSIPDVGEKTFTTSVSRSYLDNPLTALAKSMEKEMIINEMRKLAASQIIRQKARLKSDHFLTDEEELKQSETQGVSKTQTKPMTVTTQETTPGEATPGEAIPGEASQDKANQTDEP